MTAWKRYLLPSERRHLRATGWAWLEGFIDRDDLLRVLRYAKLVATCRQAQEVRS